MTKRLDAVVAERGLARSRTHAAQLIDAGLVSVDGRPVVKAATRVGDEQDVVVAASDHYVSRAAHKLIAALDAFRIDVSGRLCLDMGASTGGFTQVLRERGAARVLAPGGVVLMTSTMNFRVHNYPADYWRYTPQAFEFLLEPFGTRLVTWAGEDAFPHLVAGVGWKTPVPGDEVERLRGALEPWRQRWFYPAGPGAAQSLKRFIPPVLLSWLRRVRGYPPPPSAMPWG